MRRFRAGQAEMQAPPVFGPLHAAPKARTTNKNKWSAETFFPELRARHGEQAEQTVRDILAWAEQNLSYVRWGRGSHNGSFVPVQMIHGRQNQLFAVWTGGVVEIYFFWYQNKPPFDREDQRIELLNRLNAIPGINLPKECISRRPSIELQTLSQPEKLQRFFEVFDWYIEQVERAAGQ